MILDNTFNFSSAQVLGTGTSDVVSSNVYDAGSAIKAFAGGGNPAKISIDCSSNTSGSADATLRARFVGADDAALTSNPVILADSGVSPVEADATIAPFHLELVPSNQTVAKRYYGVMYTQSGTSPNHTVSANLVLDAQSNLVHNS
jgi:hypothetical protein